MKATSYAPRCDGGPDLRGNNRDRARRREWLVNTWRADVDAITTPAGDVIEAPPGYIGEPACRCYRCGVLLTINTVTADRITPGAHGGRYVRGNIRPACTLCQCITGGELSGQQRRKAKR